MGLIALSTKSVQVAALGGLGDELTDQLCSNPRTEYFIQTQLAVLSQLLMPS